MELLPAMQGLWHASAEVTLFFYFTAREEVFYSPFPHMKEISEYSPRNKMLNLIKYVNDIKVN